MEDQTLQTPQMPSPYKPVLPIDLDPESTDRIRALIGTTVVAGTGLVLSGTTLGIDPSGTPRMARIGIGQDADANHGIFAADSIVSKRVADSDGTTITFDWATGNSHSVTLQGSRTIAFSNQGDGQVIVLALRQHSSGGPYTVTWPGTVAWPGGIAPTLSTGASKTDVFAFYRHATDNKEYGSSVGLAY